jgi:hypothetical protein
MGASDFDMHTAGDAGGVDASPSSVIANYFLKSHGGAHLLQSASSLLATACALGAVFMTTKYSSSIDANGAVGNARWTLVLLRRTMIFAMIKHVSGLLASASLAAKAIPEIGITQSRKWMEDIVREPVAQYVFYTALILLWLPNKTFLLAASEVTTKNIATTWWWPRQRWIVSCLVGPIILRETVSNMLVISDILVLWSVGSKNDYEPIGFANEMEIRRSGWKTRNFSRIDFQSVALFRSGCRRDTGAGFGNWIHADDTRCSGRATGVV